MNNTLIETQTIERVAKFPELQNGQRLKSTELMTGGIWSNPSRAEVATLLLSFRLHNLPIKKFAFFQLQKFCMRDRIFSNCSRLGHIDLENMLLEFAAEGLLNLEVVSSAEGEDYHGYLFIEPTEAFINWMHYMLMQGELRVVDFA